MSEKAQVLDGRYLLGEVLGRGGMADVYRATDELLHRPVAVKLLRDVADDASDRARFTGEARTLAQLNHPGLVMILDAGTEGEHPYLVMELVEGTTLARLCAAGPMAASRVAGIGAQVATALAFAHHKGVVHRDVKPANVLVTGQDRTKLADFGIARLIGDTVRHTRTGQAIGTAAYLAPEQVQGREITTAADVYALGLVLLEALTGERSFPGSATEAAMARLSSGPPIPEGLPAGWGELLHAATATDPAERPPADEVADRLRDLQAADEPDDAAGSTAVLTNPNTQRLTPMPPSGGAVVPPPAAGPLPDRMGEAAAARTRDGFGRARQWLLHGPTEQRGLAAALAALLLLIVITALASSTDPDEPAGDVPADTPSELREPLQDLHDAINGVDR